MNNIINFSKHLLFGVAFVGVMAGTGGFIGAIGGVILGLLGQTVFGITSSMIMFMPLGIALGTITAMLLGIILMRQPERQLIWHSSITTGAVEQQ